MTARHRTAWTFAITSAALFMASLDNLVVTTALPSIREQLHASLEGLQWTVNAYTLTFAVLLLTGATLGERYGRRRLFTIGLGLFTAGSAAAAMAPGIGALVAARAVQGVGAAIVIPLTLTLLSAAVSPRRRGLALGAWGAVGGLAIAIGRDAKSAALDRFIGDPGVPVLVADSSEDIADRLVAASLAVSRMSEAGADRGAVARRLFGPPGDVPPDIFDRDTIV